MVNSVKFFLLIIFLSLMFNNCSYVMDSIEGAITDRASFSIDAEYDSGTQLVTVSFPDAKDETDTEAFASYEIYVTEEVNDEYASYRVIARGYDIGDSEVAKDTGLLNYNENTWSFYIQYGGTSEYVSLYPMGSTQYVNVPVTGGKLFIRVAAIEWDLKTSAKRSEKWNPLANTGYYFSSDKEYFFENYSEIDSTMSGYIFIDIPAL